MTLMFFTESDPFWLVGFIEADLSNIMNVLSLTLPVMLTSTMSHLQLAQAFSSLVNVRNVWVYDNGRLLNSQPFTSYAE